ncbi:EVE domain-containing protein [Bosea sp. LjRoot9]|uniref:EVE domain-containing protein n=1 Tax=Bosea sp. LjRoot9 TaxID=3342341 RepID=UPI003ED10B31
MNGHWFAVAAAEHVRRGLSGGFMQVCHGKGAPLRRIKPGDHVVYYSPTGTFGGLDRLQAFTAIGRVRDKEPYRADMGNGFQPFRRDVDWLEAQEAPIRPLLDRLHLTAGQRNWGYQFRFGLLRAEVHDFEIIATAMSAHAVSAVSL